MTRELTKPVRRLRVTRSGAPAAPGPSPASYGPAEPAPTLLPGTIREVLAPGLNTARFTLDTSRADGGPVHAWGWRGVVGLEDFLAIEFDEGAETLFAGFVCDVDARWQARDEGVEVTAVGRALRLKRDVIVYGRYMETKIGNVAHFSGLPCDFNAGGKPNRCAALDFEGVEGGPVAGVAFFTADDADGASYWTLSDIVDYLQWRYNAAGTWIANAALAAAEYTRTAQTEVSCEGLSLWDALAAAADSGACDVWEALQADGSSVIRVLRRGTGAAASLKRPGAVYGEAGERMDLARQNVFESSIAEENVSTVARPIVAGGYELVEITIPLLQAWDPARLALGTSFADPDHPDPAGDFATHYCYGGISFADYRDVGRLWDANTDGRYAAEPFSLAVPDVAALADLAAGSWPAMAYKPRSCLTAVGTETGRVSHEAFAEFSLDAGVTWYPLPDYQVHPDRLALWISAPNLAKICPPEEKPNLDNNLFAALAADPSQVRMRLSCTVAAPVRRILQPARRASAGSLFETAAFVDRGALGQKRRRASGDVLVSRDPTADTRDGVEEITTAAEALRDALDDRTIAAAVAVEWPDEPLTLGETVTEIEGIEYSLSTGANATRIVQIQRLLTHDTWAMVVSLGTTRKSGIQ